MDLLLTLNELWPLVAQKVGPTIDTFVKRALLIRSPLRQGSITHSKRYRPLIATDPLEQGRNTLRSCSGCARGLSHHRSLSTLWPGSTKCVNSQFSPPL